MSAVILDFATHARRALRMEADVIRKETTEEIVRREVMSRCLKAGVPLEMARIQADTACATVRAGREPSSAVKRAVYRAIKGAFPDNEPPSAA